MSFMRGDLIMDHMLLSTGNRSIAFDQSDPVRL